MPPFQGELFMRKGWSSSRDGLRFPKSLLLGDMIRKCPQSSLRLIKSTELLYIGRDKEELKEERKGKKKKTPSHLGKKRDFILKMI